VSQFAWDAIYKLNTLKYPLITTVTQDSTHLIFPTSFTIASTESEASYSFVLCALKKAYMKIFKQSLNYKYIMSNGADYIFNASEKNLEEDHIHLMCYFHVKKAIKRNFAKKKYRNKTEKRFCIALTIYIQ